MKILLTGITGFIGGHLCQQLITDRQHTIVALIRPKTKQNRYDRFAKHVKIVETDLTDAGAINRIFQQDTIEWMFHLAAMRGGGAASKEEFDRINIEAPVVLANAALKHGAKFLFCSSVGVFGTIPQRLPPTEETSKIGDNYYHYTKIEAEKQLLALQQQGLQLSILRPIITYGTGDRGFPFLLIKLIEKGILLLPTRDITIHLVDVRTLIQAFINVSRTPSAIGKIYTITDKEPVSLRMLVHHISMKLCGKPYPGWKIFPTFLYRLAESGFEHLLKNDAWMTRVKLMSRDWYYDGSFAEKELGIQSKETIPNIDYVVEWYKHVTR